MSEIQSQDSFDKTKAEAFAGNLLSTLNQGALCLMLSIGHRTRLFDAMRGLAPATSPEIATRAGLNECYVREWLNTMVCARIVEYDAGTSRYMLPPEHAAYLTQASDSDNMALFFQYVGIIAGVEDDVLECFRRGGGVRYDRYPRFHAVMAEESAQSVIWAFEPHILPLVSGLTGRLEAGIRVLDVGCGSGRIMNQPAATFPKTRFHGLDLSAEAIERARSEARDRGLKNVEFDVKDVTDFDETAPVAAYELVTTFDAVHDQAQRNSRSASRNAAISAAAAAMETPCGWRRGAGRSAAATRQRRPHAPRPARSGTDPSAARV